MKLHLNVLLRGLIRVIFSTATAGSFALAVYAFWVIPGTGGYIAVADFLIGTTALGVALVGTYLSGGKAK